jgi:hypothetical protein
VSKKPITVVDVAKRLGGVSRQYVHTLDPVLQPRRSETGVRLYRADAVDEFVRDRESKKESGR